MAADAKRFYTTEKLGEKQELTPEGFLVCRDVPLARTGDMEYSENEPVGQVITAGPDGLIRVKREEKEVFHPRFMASFVGKPFIITHPKSPDGVTPDTYKDLVAGTVMSVRRGDAPDTDLLFGDILVGDCDAIELIRSGVREVSCGYDAEYEELQPGVGRQYDMVANHVALVDEGRCGPRCAIGDAKPKRLMTGDHRMKTQDRKLNWLDRLLKAVKTKDEAEIEKAVDAIAGEAEEVVKDAESGAVHIHAGGEAGTRDEDAHARIDALEAGHAMNRDDIEALKTHTGFKDAGEEDPMEEELEEEAPGVTDAKKATDSRFLDTSFQDAASGAEILAPGIRIPAFDLKAKPKLTLDAICRLRKSALDLAYATTDGRGQIDEVLAGKTLDSMKCGEIRTTFRAAVALRKAANRGALQVDRTRVVDKDAPKPIRSIAELNKRNAEFHAAQRRS